MIYKILVFGALGGMCPTIARLASFYSASSSSQLPEASVLIALTLFAILGGIIAVATGSTEVRAAILAGIAAPSIVVSMVSGGKEAALESADVAGLFSLSAYAQDAPTPLQMGDEIFLTPKYTGVAPSGGANINLKFIDRNGNTVAQEDFQVQDDVPIGIAVPESAQSIQIGDSIAELSRIDGALDLEIETDPTFLGDLYWAFGAQRQYSITGYELQP